MKTGVILFISCACLLGTTWGQSPYDPIRRRPFSDETRELRREEALQEKADNSTMRRRAQLLVKENRELENQLDSLTRQLEQKDETIQKLENEIDSLNKKIEALESTAENVTADGVIIDGLTVHSKPFFDIYLGELYQSAAGRIEVESESITLHDKDRPGKTYRIKPTRDNIETLCVRVHRDRVYEIIVSYKDTSTKNYDSIKKQLLKTFHPKEKDSMDIAVSGDCMYTTVIDGVPVDIMVDHVAKTGKPRSLTLHYIHRLLLEGKAVKKTPNATASARQQRPPSPAKKPVSSKTSMEEMMPRRSASRSSSNRQTLSVELLRSFAATPEMAQIDIRMKNNSNTFLAAWSINVMAYGRGGGYLGKAMAIIENLSPGSSRVTEAIFMDVPKSRISRFEFENETVMSRDYNTITERFSLESK